MPICSSCGKGTLSPILKSKPYLIIKEMITQNEIDSDTVFVQHGKNRYGKEEHSSSYYLNKEMGRVGVQMGIFSMTNLYMHIPPKGGRTKEGKEMVQGCMDYSVSEVVRIAKDMKIIFLMGAGVIKLFTGYNASSVYGLICKSELLPNVPVIIPSPNSDKIMAQPVGELRNSLRILAEKIKSYEQYTLIGA